MKLMTVVEDEQAALYRRWLDGGLTLDEYLTAEPLPVLHERLTFAPTADGGLRVVWVTDDGNEQARAA